MIKEVLHHGSPDLRSNILALARKRNPKVIGFGVLTHFAAERLLHQTTECMIALADMGFRQLAIQQNARFQPQLDHFVKTGELSLLEGAICGRRNTQNAVCQNRFEESGSTDFLPDFTNLLKVARDLAIEISFVETADDVDFDGELFMAGKLRDMLRESKVIWFGGARHMTRNTKKSPSALEKLGWRTTTLSVFGADWRPLPSWLDLQLDVGPVQSILEQLSCPLFVNSGANPAFKKEVLFKQLFAPSHARDMTLSQWDCAVFYPAQGGNSRGQTRQ